MLAPELTPQWQRYEKERQDSEKKCQRLEAEIQRAMAAGFKAEVANLQQELATAERRGASTTRALTQIQYVCCDCGYSETYLQDPRELAENQELKEWIRWSWHVPPSRGPYG